MTTELDSWPRKHFTAGGGEPFLFYVVFGEIDAEASLSRSKYRCGGIVEGIEIVTYGPDANPEVPSSFLEGYLWEQAQAEQANLASKIEQCDHCMAFRGSPADDSTLDYFRDTIGFITFALDHGGCAVYDPFMFKWWSPKRWKRNVFAPAAPLPHNHTTILVSEGDQPGTQWYHTRGMRKFGRPDISIKNVTAEQEPVAIEICNRLIEHQAFGYVVPDGQEVHMEALDSTPVIRHAGSLDDPEFNNVHLSIKF